MYQKKSHGWYKHKDFILLDLLCIFLAFIFAYYIRNHTYISITDNGVYRNAMIFVLFADLVQNVYTLNRKCTSTLQSLRYFVPTISERRVFPKYCIKRENQCRSRAAAEIQSDEAVED